MIKDLLIVEDVIFSPKLYISCFKELLGVLEFESTTREDFFYQERLNKIKEVTKQTINSIVEGLENKSLTGDSEIVINDLIIGVIRQCYIEYIKIKYFSKD